MISGVHIKKIEKHVDDRGYFSEVLKADDPFFKKILQTSFSMTKPGVIKAFHYHKKQDDCFFCPFGEALVALYDLRKKSDTYRESQKIIVGEDNLCLIYIPKGIAHGYKVLGNKPCGMFYHTTRKYDPKDEFRIDHDDPKLGFDWSRP